MAKKAPPPSARDALRAASVGASIPRVVREVVLVQDPETGLRGGIPEWEREADENGLPVLEPDPVDPEAPGTPKLKRDEFGLFVPKRDADGEVVLVEVDRGFPRYSVEVRLPTGEERARILRAAKLENGKQDVDSWKLRVEVCLALAVLPGTSDRVWERADRERLMSQPAGGFVDAVGAVGQALLWPEVAALGKAARRTLTALSSSGSHSASAE